MPATSSSSAQPPSVLQQIWWSNAFVFLTVHAAACVGVYYHPLSSTPRATLILAVVLWQAACFSITIGYHRLYSHRSFEAGQKTRAFLAVLGTSAFQGSIKWWVLRHRLHHRYTDDPVHDPYSATRGLMWSHMGWIFFKHHYERMKTIDREDLEQDSIVRFQHQYYAVLALSTAIVFPTLLGTLWNDAMGALIWAGLVARIAVWHCTFLVNSLAHWDGLQPYSDENTSRVNLIVAVLTCGEGNHNYHHAFPQDFRSDPSIFAWDPSKWIILGLQRIGFARDLRQAREEDLSCALWRMHFKTHVAPDDLITTQKTFTADVPPMTVAEIRAYVLRVQGRCILAVDNLVVDVTEYLHDHPGGDALLRKYSIKAKTFHEDQPDERVKELRDRTTAAFQGGINKHTLAAYDRLKELAVGCLVLY